MCPPTTDPFDDTFPKEQGRSLYISIQLLLIESSQLPERAFCVCFRIDSFIWNGIPAILSLKGLATKMSFSDGRILENV
jgi:hypothetical protein